MKIIKRIVLIGCLFFCCKELSAQNTDSSELLQVTKQFQRAIVEKDSFLFKELFLHDSIPWIGISGSKSWDYHKTSHPGVKQIDVGSCVGFIRYIVSYAGRIEEKLFHIKIHFDEVLATLSFDYSFWKDQLPFNWGKESWILVKTKGKWKIAGVYYSGYHQAVEPTPPHLL